MKNLIKMNKYVVALKHVLYQGIYAYEASIPGN